LAPVVTFIDPSLIPVMLLVLMIPLNFYVAARERGHIDWTGARWISIGRFAGPLAGLGILLSVSRRQRQPPTRRAQPTTSVRARSPPAVSPSRPVLAAVGLIPGVTGTSTGVGGPPYALAYQHSPGPELRSTVAVCFLVGEVISLIVLAFSGQITAETMIATAWRLPFLAIGSFLSRYVHHRLDGPLLRCIVLGVAVVAGAIVIGQA